MKQVARSTVLWIALLTVLIAAPALAQGGSTYVVRPGDTLTYIAARHGLTATQLASANDLSWNAWVYTGQKLQIPDGTAGASTQTSAPAPAATGGTYVVRRGDSLSSIAQRYGVTVAQLAAANGLRRNAWVYTRQTLKIPGRAVQPATQPATQSAAQPEPAASSTYIVHPGDTLIRIAMRHGLNVRRLAMANGMHVNAWVYVGQPLKIPDASPAAAIPSTAATGGAYVVRPGDSLIGIAIRHGISVSRLASANGLSATAWVYVGQTFKIPGLDAAQAAPPSPPKPKPTPTPRPARPASRQADPASRQAGKWIDVNLTTQTLTAYVGNKAVLRTKVSTGTRYTPTVVGTYRVYSKYRAVHMSGPGYSVPNVPHTMFFYRGYAIHGTYWHNNFGTPMSHGCVNMTQADAKWLYEWAPKGTKVVTHY